MPKCRNLTYGELESCWICSKVKFNTQTNELVQLKEWRQKGQWIVWE